MTIGRCRGDGGVEVEWGLARISWVMDVRVGVSGREYCIMVINI